MTIDYREKALSLLALELAHDNTGIYPQAVTQNNVTTKRTEWQDGWNACSMDLTKDWCTMSDWLKQLPNEVQDYLLEEKLSVSVDGKIIKLFVNCNDLFAWGCSDAELLELTDLEDFKQALIDSPDHGAVLWACRKRKCKPQKPYYKSFNNDEIVFFNSVED